MGWNNNDPDPGQFLNGLFEAHRNFVNTNLYNVLKNYTIIPMRACALPFDSVHLVLTDGIMGVDGVACIIWKEGQLHGFPQASEECADFILNQCDKALQNHGLSHYVTLNNILGREIFTGDLVGSF